MTNPIRQRSFLTWAVVIRTTYALQTSTGYLYHGQRLSKKANPLLHSLTPLKSNLLDNIFNQLIPKTEDQGRWPKVSVPPNFVVPEPKPLTITESADVRGILTASAGLALRLGTGAFVLGWYVESIFAPIKNSEGIDQYCLKLGPFRIRDSSSVLKQVMKPKETLVLFDNDSSPNCKRVRELLNILDITYECRPCFDASRNEWGIESNRSLPYLYDPNVDETIFGDEEIILNLLINYGPPPSAFDCKALWPITFKQFSLITSQLAEIIRGNRGNTQQTNARPDNARMKSIELWGYECSPFVRPVKEKLSSLGLPYRLVSCSRGSKNRDEMVKQTGRFQVPYIVDSNTGVSMFEGPEIVQYLEAVYTVPP